LKNFPNTKNNGKHDKKNEKQNSNYCKIDGYFVLFCEMICTKIVLFQNRLAKFDRPCLQIYQLVLKLNFWSIWQTKPRYFGRFSLKTNIPFKGS